MKQLKGRSKPLRVVTACAFFVIMISMAVLPTFAASAGYKGEDTYIAGSNIQTAEIIGAVSKYDLPYQSAIVGDNPTFFGNPQKSQTVINGNSVIITSKIVFDETITITSERDEGEYIIPMYDFYAYTPLGEAPTREYANKIKVVWREYVSHEQENIELWYISLDGHQTMVYWGYLYYSSSMGRYVAEGHWISDGYRTIYPKGGTGETPWTAELDGIAFYNWLRENGTFTNYAGSGNASSISGSPFTRTWLMETNATKETNNRVKATTKYTIKGWWQATGKPLSIRFYGQNIVIDQRTGHYYPVLNELDDVSPFNPTITYKVRYTYFFNNSHTVDEERWEIYTGEKTIQGTWHEMYQGITGANLYPTIDQIFGTEAATRIGGIIYDEYETTLSWIPPENYLQNNFTLNVTDYYYIGSERRANEVAGFFDSFRRNFDSTMDPEYSTLGGFLSESIGGFFNTPILGDFSLGVIILTVVGIGLVITFLKMFAGG